MISDDERIIIVTPTPVFGLWTLELAQNIGSKYDAALVDNESFMADPKSLYDLMDVLLKLPIRPKAVTFLSGDVHYGFSVSGMISSPKRKNKVPIPIAQFTSSPMKNLTEGGLSTVLGVIQKKAIDSFDEIYLRHWLKKNKDEFAIDADRIRTSIAKHLLFWPEEIPDLLDIYRFHIQSKGDLFEMRNNIGYFEMTAKNIKNQLLVWTNSGLKTSMKTNWRILKDVWPVQFPEGTLERFHYYIQQPESKTIQKPFYMIANCCNDVGHIRKVMNRGFNAMEIDLRMNDSGEIIADFTGAYSWSTLWTDWLQEAESLPKRLSNKLALLMLDIKEYNPKLVEKLRDSLRKSRLRNTPRVFCVEDIDAGKKTFTKKFISSLNEKESISIFYSESPLDVLDWMNSTKKLANGKGWYADGINTLKIGHSQYAIDRNLRAGMRLRDQGDFSKIFSWTYEKNSSVIEKILSGCDGLVVNTGSGEKGSGQGTYYKWALDYEKIMNKMSSIVRWATKADF